MIISYVLIYRDFLTGFHKRKEARKKRAKELTEELIKKERKELKQTVEISFFYFFYFHIKALILYSSNEVICRRLVPVLKCYFQSLSIIFCRLVDTSLHSFKFLKLCQQCFSIVLNLLRN